ncbi:Uncharacterised protein [Burkholderia pseudomallei]|uniref:hypothetical protein n=1 Tax=Burkholderia pseudomallei TaxID=28450 RepID=UPI000F1CD5CB|nr:hypothetical protein [Burkholderia pseudomallei]MBF4048813.1 hypothetical protein [Burkholderia pseudomallei]CAJ4113890.1 Uncharacterised protein [Burkholderia pseudomallei]CAJ5047249.1 Uncharacterised protein [Burkholderia pseudomallei]CAJ6856837.1 Uncharacterised protein [Burkholderia pseudomallei]CAJ7291435.1 Uncharacterised protein [Burkholderia pseudomallei]
MDAVKGNYFDKDGMAVVGQVAYESFAEYLRVAFERDGFSGVITLCERLADAAKQYGRGSGAEPDEVLAKISGYFLREVGAELRS